ncbi:MAG: sigma 54-interacting transcriptional regulator [Desulfitobacterium hafniense]|nr:sigma 54-interacting transcriptional regulator [Desulfitobacterium hafniense]
MDDISPNKLSWDDLKKILDNSFDEIFVVNSQGIVIYVNEASERHYGLKPSSVIGKSVYHLVKEGYYSPVILPVVFREKQRITLEQETNSGRKLVVTATPVLTVDGEIDFIVMNSRDITEIQELKRNLEETKNLVKRYKNQVKKLKEKDPNTFESYRFCSKRMKSCLELAERVASVDSTILILGESGTGKTFLAKNLHKNGKRKNGPFISLNCATIPEQLLESELFGYCRGAFTGADKCGKVGLVELAKGGTLFLDEIGEISLGIQAKLLELIQERRFIPVGAKEHKQIDIKIIAATNRNLTKLVKEKKFREDLYYRLNVIEIEIPPLREIQDDIIPLLGYFLNKYNLKHETFHQFDNKCLDILVDYAWPGNIREMEHLVERLVVTISETFILAEHLPRKILENQSNQSNVHKLSKRILPWGNSLKETEKELVIQLYKELKSSYKVANALKISQSKVARIIRKYLDQPKAN